MKRKLPVFLILLFISSYSFSQSVGIGTTTPDPSAVLEIKASNKGLLIPRMNLSSITAISNPAKGLIVFDTISSQLMVNTGTAAIPNWQAVAANNGNSSGWSLAGNGGTNPAVQFIGTIDNQPLRFRVNNTTAGELNPVNGNINWGLRAGLSGTTGFSNIAIGTDALKFNIVRPNLLAIGDSALFHNNPNDPLSFQSTANTAIGSKSLFNNSTGSNNTAVGYQSLFSNTNGTNNAGFGRESLFANTSGGNNTAAGDQSLHSNTTGSANTAFGQQALFSNTTGSNNTAVGEQALLIASTTSNNTAFGFASLTSNGDGDENTAVGSQSLLANNQGGFNTAIGYQSLRSNTTGTFNTATGTRCLLTNTIGGANTANGYQSLFQNTTGGENTAIGYVSLSGNTTGSQNTALGTGAIFGNTTGGFNTAVGYDALLSNKEGTGNTAMGAMAMTMNGGTNSHDNTVMGYLTMSKTVGSFSNTVIGSHAATNFNLGSGNTFIGASSDVNQDGLINCVAIGASSICTASNQVRFGNASTTSIGGIVGFTNLSDGRYKKNIGEAVKGLDFIMKLRPVTYQLDMEAINIKLNAYQPGKLNKLSRRTTNENNSTVFSGFVAQEVEQAAKDANYDFSGVDKPKNDSDMYGLRYADFVVPLVKALQEQQQTITDLRKRVEELEKKK